MRQLIRVNLKKNSYNILIGKPFTELVHWLPEIKSKKILVITDTNVEKLYLQKLGSSLKEKKYDVNFCIIPAGEQYKNLNEINKIYKSCVESGLDRDSLIIALGGGVVGDMAGFVAATYLRGIRFIQVPTTLLAQVDASIGGKTGIDLEFGKNLVGAFHQPSLVWIDPEFLKTLDDREYKNGLAEVIKYVVICENYWDFFKINIAKILNRDSEILQKVLYMCAKAKANVVSKDEKEAGLRKILNFGHTLGHAIETNFNYCYKHGEMVAVGMAFASFVAVKMELCDKSVETILVNLLKRILPMDDFLEKFKRQLRTRDDAVKSIKIDDIVEIMARDKKMSDGKIDFILLKSFGKVEIVSLSLDDIKKMLEYWSNE